PRRVLVDNNLPFVLPQRRETGRQQQCGEDKKPVSAQSHVAPQNSESRRPTIFPTAAQSATQKTWSNRPPRQLWCWGQTYPPLRGLLGCSRESGRNLESPYCPSRFSLRGDGVSSPPRSGCSRAFRPQSVHRQSQRKRSNPAMSEL